MAKKKIKKKKKSVKKKISKKKKSSKKKSKPKKKLKSKKKSSAKKVLRHGYQPEKGEIMLGIVEDFFSHIGVIALTLKSPLSVGDRIHVKGHTTDFIETVSSMQIHHGSVESAKKKDSIGIKVADKCRKGDDVYKVG